jgi:hypothetical protein
MATTKFTSPFPAAVTVGGPGWFADAGPAKAAKAAADAAKPVGVGWFTVVPCHAGGFTVQFFPAGRHGTGTFRPAVPNADIVAFVTRKVA